MNMEVPLTLEARKAELREISGQLYAVEVGAEHLQAEGVKLGLFAVPLIAFHVLRLRARAKVLRTCMDELERLIAEAGCEQKN